MQARLLHPGRGRRIDRDDAMMGWGPDSFRRHALQESEIVQAGESTKLKPRQLVASNVPA